MASAEWADREDVVSRRTSRLSIEVAECVEEKIVKTITMTKRSYPPLFVRPPQTLQSLDAKEYPLAHKPTPPSLAAFSYQVDGKTVCFREEDGKRPENTPPQASQVDVRRRRSTRTLRKRGDITRDALRRHRVVSALPATPDPSEAEASSYMTDQTPEPRRRREEPPAVATPDLSLNISAAQNASLPSPSLSPTVAAQQLLHQLPSDTEDASEEEAAADPRSMIDAFDSMSDEMKTYMMYQFLRRCPRRALHTIAGVVNPALTLDFLQLLPPELSLHVLSFLRFRDLCRAAQVSKRWRTIIDTNETGWKDRFDQDGFVLPEGELERAVREGWGWQDPFGPDGAERDLSRYTTPEPIDEPRGSIKRKRAATSTTERKRRAVSLELSNKRAALNHKSAGPNSAASAAALAIPNPPVGLPSLRQLHLFKSLYRRHFLFRSNWKSQQPHHMAFPAHPRHVITCLQFDDDKILTGSDDTFIHVYDTKTGQLRKKLKGHDGGVWALQYDGNTLVSGSTDRSVRVWDIDKGICTHVFHGHTSTVRCLQILMPSEVGNPPVMVPEKPLIITGSRDSQLRVWRLPEPGSRRYLQTGPHAHDTDCPYFVRTLTGHTQSVRAIAAHQDTLVSGSYDYTVRVWKISTGECVHRLLGHGMKVYSVILDHERNRCISGSMDNTIRIWSLDTGACLYKLEGHSSLVGLLDLRDQRLVSAAADSTLRIWDPENGQCKSTLTAHTGAITCFQHDGQKVISGSDRTLKMWDVRTGECVQDLLTDLSGVWQVKFDSRRCVAAVQRDNLTYVEVLDFGAVRDGVPAEQRGRRMLLQKVDAERVADD